MPHRQPFPAPCPCSGGLYSVKQGDIKLVLPGGGGRSAGDLSAVAAEASREAAAGDGLLLLAWEVAEGDGEQLRR
jgi:hypothetical protein